ncbi:LamG-like jellyroll fold domain-containing protein, partial [Bdellovibrionota bacterium FG-1]
GGTFYTDACSTPAAGSAITIANGANSGTFYYKSTGSGARSLTASAASGVILSNTLAATVTPSKFVVTVVAASFDNATCGGPFTITSQDSTSTTANATSTLTVDLSQTGGAHGVFYSDNVCSAGISSRTITAGTSTATFYYKDTTASETPTLTAADHAGSLTSGTVGVTITAQIINIIQSGLALNLDASLGDGSGFVGAGCGTTTWKDLISSTNATLSNFAGCDGTTGWNGTGTANDPYRLNFPGNTDDHVQFPTISLPSGVTAEAWIYPTNTTMDGFIVEKTAVNAEWELFISTSQLIWRGGSSTLEVHAPAPSANAWHHVVGTQSGTTAAIYIDGVLAASGTVAAIPNGTGTIQVGNFEAGSYYFSGGIAAVRVYSGKFLANQVARNCNAQKSHFSGVTCPTMTTPSTITITHGYMGLNKNTCAALDIVLKDGSGNLSERMSATQIDLSNNGSAIYYSDSNCATPITSTIIPDGLNTKTIYIKDTTAETPTLTAADHAGSLTPGTVALMVTTPIPLLAGFFGSTMAVINGKAYCMGTNFYGACGVGAYVDAPLYSPVAVNNVTRVTALMSTDGGASVHCLVDDGKAKCMGYGVMGDGKTEGCAYGTTCTALSPVQVSGLDASGGSSTITTQVAGSSNSTFCALTQNGAVRCWGNNVGDGSTTFSLTPVATTLTSGVTKIAGSRSNVMAVQNGALYYWGDTLLTPTLVTTYDGSTAAKTVVDVAGSNNQNNAGGERFCAVTADGGASCQDGLLILPAGSGASKIVAGASHFCVVYTGGVRCANTRGGQYWSPVGDISLGDNVTYNPGRSGDATHFITDISQAIGLVQIGQSGTHNNDGVGSPSTFASTDILAIGTGYEHVCVITAGNMMSCWGVNHYGEMGTGSTDNTEYRVAIPTVTAWP